MFVKLFSTMITLLFISANSVYAFDVPDNLPSFANFESEFAIAMTRKICDLPELTMDHKGEAIHLGPEEGIEYEVYNSAGDLVATALSQPRVSQPSSLVNRILLGPYATTKSVTPGGTVFSQNSCLFSIW